MTRIVSTKIRNAARGEPCTVNIVGVCNHDPATTVLAHLPHEGGAMGSKSTDLSACFACGDCHDAIDRRRWCEELEEHRHWYLRRANIRTLERLYEMGLIKIEGVK